jgi:WD40 repeat protein
LSFLLVAGCEARPVEGESRPQQAGEAKSQEKQQEQKTPERETAPGKPTQRALLKGHDGPSCLAFSPDGKRLAVGCSNGSVKLREVATGKEQETLESGLSYVSCVAFSPPDGKVLVAGSAEAVKLFDTSLPKREPRTLTLRVRGYPFGATCLTFAPDGNHLFGNWSHMVGWDVNGKRDDVEFDDRSQSDRDFDTSAFSVESMAFAPDGQTVALGGHDGQLVLWDAVMRKKQATLRKRAGEESPVVVLGFTPDGKTLVSGDGKLISLWDCAGKKLQGSFPGPAQPMALAKDCKTLASAAAPKGLFDKPPAEVVLWEVVSGNKRATLEGHRDGITCLAFSPDGTILASGSNDTRVILWDIPPGRTEK